MRVIFIMIISMILLSCQKKKIIDKKYPVYIISEKFREYEVSKENYKKGNNDSITIVQPLLPKYLYGTDNFILDKESNVFYYQQKDEFIRAMCGTGMEEEMEKDSIPIFKNLTPEIIIQIPLNSIEDFLKLNFRKGKRNLVKIASQKDTLNSNAYYKLVEALDKCLNFKNDNDVWVIYPSTQEEDTVLFYKKIDKEYNSQKIKWDLKRIKFLKNN